MFVIHLPVVAVAVVVAFPLARNRLLRTVAKLAVAKLVVAKLVVAKLARAERSAPND
ncbi:hypothetical protein WCLP8_1280012 [uncultured Gammaproteobacteria bacterium]